MLCLMFIFLLPFFLCTGSFSNCLSVLQPFIPAEVHGKSTVTNFNITVRTVDHRDKSEQKEYMRSVRREDKVWVDNLGDSRDQFAIEITCFCSVTRYCIISTLVTAVFGLTNLIL
ncbi:uncharacterized protein EDB91DRAFT_1077255 [Suillus paluster]|uniref:uncharacterized protein n=1 Tax=Suillus paluster TaxID=48578 RepID=UPI001B86A3DB|nr:uncharacterized protein EDB91DRAFT_1077255 [Suillus paluster]KAG1755283.1 hypothetical protein EDB91DRAFT_1077255 [Suillus paluster]